jgi:hypothetical protein
VQHRRAEHAPRADFVNHELQRLRLIDRCERTGAPRERLRQARRTNRLRADEPPLRDGDRRFGNRYDVAGACESGQRFTQQQREIIAFNDQARPHRDRYDAVGQRRLVNRDRDHAESPATICSMRYMREPLSSTRSSVRACSRSHAIASSFVA